MRKFIVYKHIFPNGKMYIGITSVKPNQRWESGSGYSETHQNVMYKAIKKYGWENIKHEILFTDLTEKEAKEKEIQLIKELHTYIHDPECNGYNMTTGGESSCGRKMSDEQKEKISKFHSGRTGKMCVNSKPIICDGIEYESLTELKKKYKIKGRIARWLDSRNTMPKEWYDRGLHYKGTDFSKIRCREKEYENKIFYDNKIFKSQAEFARYIGVTPSAVTLWLNGINPIPNELIEKGFKRL